MFVLYCSLNVLQANREGLDYHFNNLDWTLDRVALDGIIIVVGLEVQVTDLAIPSNTLAWLGRQIQVTWF